MTNEERQSIVNEVVERVMLSIPDVIGNLITNHMSLLRMNRKFYSDHPELKDKKDIVASVVEMIEGKNPLDDYEEVLRKAVPEIKKRIDTVGSLNTKSVKKPNRIVDLGDL